jgi:hypothetical protein
LNITSEPTVKIRCCSRKKKETEKKWMSMLQQAIKLKCAKFTQRGPPSYLTLVPQLKHIRHFRQGIRPSSLTQQRRKYRPLVKKNNNKKNPYS